MDITRTNIFPYIEGDFLVGLKDVVLTMTHVTEEDLPTHNGKTERKFVLYFKETEKGLVLNKTNCKTIIGLYGKMTEGWAGKKIAIYGTEVKAFGQLHNAIRIREYTPKNGNGSKPQAAPPPPADEPMPQAEAIPPADEREETAEEQAELDAIFGPKALNHYTME